MDPVSRAQAGNNQETGRIARLKGNRWPKGVSGNPNGRPKKNHVTKMFDRILAKKQNRKMIEEAILKTLLKGGMAPVLLLREIAERTEGKVSQAVEISGEITLGLAETIEKRRKAIADRDDQPRAIAS